MCHQPVKEMHKIQISLWDQCKQSRTPLSFCLLPLRKNGVLRRIRAIKCVKNNVLPLLMLLNGAFLIQEVSYYKSTTFIKCLSYQLSVTPEIRSVSGHAVQCNVLGALKAKFGD